MGASGETIMGYLEFKGYSFSNKQSVSREDIRDFLINEARKSNKLTEKEKDAKISFFEGWKATPIYDYIQDKKIPGLSIEELVEQKKIPEVRKRISREIINVDRERKIEIIEKNPEIVEEFPNLERFQSWRREAANLTWEDVKMTVHEGSIKAGKVTRRFKDFYNLTQEEAESIVGRLQAEYLES